MYEIFERLLTLHKISAYKVGKATGIPTSTFTAWKKGISAPKQDKLDKIADYFGVTIDYLMGKEGGEDNKVYYLDDETAERLQSLKVNDKLRILFDASRGLEPSDIDFVLDMVERLSKERE